MNATAVLPPPGQRRLILIAIILGTILQVLDLSVATITLPHMQGSLSATQDQISWVMTTYMVAAVMMTPFTGALAGRIGRKRLLLISVVGFAVTSILVSQSTSLIEIVVLRFIQGAFAAAFMPVGQSTLLDIFPQEELALAMGWRSLGTMFGMSVGPVIGGYIVEFENWRWGFYINVPIAIAAFVMIYAFVPESSRRRDDPLNWFGFLMLATGLGSLQFVLNRGQRMDWFDSGEIVVAAMFAAVGFYLFTVNSLVARRPFIDPSIFKDRTFVVGMILVFVFVWMMFSILVLMPAFLQDIRGFPIADVGKIMGVRAGATMFASVIAGWLVQRSGSRRIIVLGLLCVACGEWQMSLFTTDVDMTFILIANALFGLGSGFAFVPLNVTSFWTLEPRHRGMAAGLFSLMTILGGSTGISIMITNLVRSAQSNRSVLVEYLTPYNEVLRHAPLPPGWSFDYPAGLSILANEVQRQAMMIAYVNDFRLLSFLTLMCVPLVYFMRRPNPKLPASGP
jgi:DHA2 family multidrug resistance protein